jgi:hypothetical protein
MKNTRLGARHGVLWYQQLASAFTLSLLGYGITGANVSLAYFDLLYAVLGLIAVMTLQRHTLVADTATATDPQPAASGNRPRTPGIPTPRSRYGTKNNI